MTEVCRKFRNTGSCKFGDACKFEHTEGEPITTWDPKPAEECFKFRDNNGECDHGDRCRFMHGSDDSRFVDGVRDLSQEVICTLCLAL